MTPDTQTLERIAEGQRAAVARDAFGKALDDCVDAKLRELDGLSDFNPQWAYGLLKEIAAYRRMRKQLDHKVTVGERAAASLVPANTPDGDAGH